MVGVHFLKLWPRFVNERCFNSSQLTIGNSCPQENKKDTVTSCLRILFSSHRFKNIRSASSEILKKHFIYRHSLMLFNFYYFFKKWLVIAFYFLPFPSMAVLSTEIRCGIVNKRRLEFILELLQIHFI